jgi:hypothetical protein
MRQNRQGDPRPARVTSDDDMAIPALPQFLNMARENRGPAVQRIVAAIALEAPHVHSRGGFPADEIRRRRRAGLIAAIRPGNPKKNAFRCVRTGLVKAGCADEFGASREYRPT